MKPPGHREQGPGSPRRLRRSALFASGAAPLWVAILTVLLPGCDKPPKNTGPEYGSAPAGPVMPVYRFAVHPLHNPAKLTQSYQPLMDWLNGNMPGVRFSLEASRDYANFEAKYRTRALEFILSNPWQALDAMKHGYRVIAMAGEPEDFKGLILVRQDSGIRQPADLKGRAVSYPSPTALAACIMPQYFFHRHGVDVNRDLENRYVGSQESSILNVYAKMTAAGATWPPPWRDFQKTHPAEAAQLRVAWETEPLINNAVMVRDDLPTEIATQLQKLLTGLPETAPGRALLAGMETARFIPATDQDYAVVRTYVDRFEQEVRKVETP